MTYCPLSYRALSEAGAAPANHAPGGHPIVVAPPPVSRGQDFPGGHLRRDSPSGLIMPTAHCHRDRPSSLNLHLKTRRKAAAAPPKLADEGQLCVTVVDRLRLDADQGIDPPDPGDLYVRVGAKPSSAASAELGDPAAPEVDQTAGRLPPTELPAANDHAGICMRMRWRNTLNSANPDVSRPAGGGQWPGQVGCAPFFCTCYGWLNGCGRQSGLLRGRRGLQARKSRSGGRPRPRSAGQARTAPVSVRGRAREASGTYGRIADRAGHSRDR